MNNSMPTNLITKWTNSLKDTICQNSRRNGWSERPMSIKEIEWIINNLPKQKAPSPDRFTGQFYQIFKKEVTPTLYNLFQRIEAEGLFSNSSYETRKRHYKTTKPQDNISHNHRCKHPQQNISNQIQKNIKIIPSWSSEIYPRYARLVQYSKIN